MKSRTLLTFLTLVSLLPLSSAFTQETSTAAQILEAAKAAEQSGDYPTAAAYYQALSRSYPGDVRIRAAAARTAMLAKEGRPKGSLEAQLKSLIIPNLEFVDADLNSVFAFLSQKATELSDGKLQANFIYKGTSEERHEPIISLKLTNVPFTDVIRYVGDLSRTQFKFETHAIVGTPRRLLLPGTSSTSEPSASGNPFP